MKKAEYINKYGEEAYKEKLASSRRYHQEHKEEIRARKQKHYSENKEVTSIRSKNYRERNVEKIKEQKKKYYIENKGHVKEARERYLSTMEGRANAEYNNYKSSDLINQREGFNLTPEWIIENIFNSKCIYCGETDWHKLGCDRIDNKKAHTTDNCVCACGSCNRKRGLIPFQEYLLSVNPSEASDILSSLGLD